VGLEQARVKMFVRVRQDTIDGLGGAEYMTQLTILTSVPRTEQHSIVSDQ